MLIKYTTKRSDYVSYVKYMRYLKHSFDFALAKILLISLGIMLCFHLSGGLNIHKLPHRLQMIPRLQVEAITYALMFAISVLCLSLIIKLSRHHRYSKLILQHQHPVTLSLMADGITYKKGKKKKSLSWSSIHTIINRGHAIYMLSGAGKSITNNPIIIPKSTFKNEIDFLNFQSLIVNKTQKKIKGMATH